MFYSYSTCSKLCTDSLMVFIACLVVDKLIFQNFVLEPQSSFPAHWYVLVCASKHAKVLNVEIFSETSNCYFSCILLF